VEEKWRKFWGNKGLAKTDFHDDTKKKYYNLVMFPYPSGDKLHLGHWFNYGPVDSWGRYLRMKGYKVFQPMGFDSFGLPAENYAIKTGIKPQISIKSNVDNMIEQLTNMGALWDWDKTVSTSSPEYYKWTQWVFLQLYNKGLAYKKLAPVNWCPSCQTVLANEQVDNGCCERCGSEVTKKNLVQWFLKITDYAEDLLDYSAVDWPEKTIAMQENWIGRSEGSEIDFGVEGVVDKIRVYTTRIDTLFGCTYVVVAPEHPFMSKLVTEERRSEVESYVDKSLKMSDIERLAEGREKSGVFTGSYAVNPINGNRVPIWVADYVIGHYGTGAVMAVPAHDERDFEFAEKHGLEVLEVVKNAKNPFDGTGAMTEDGVLINSDDFSGMKSKEARVKITEALEKNENGSSKVNYRLRDWLISRQRYWGAPIPVVYDPEGNAHPVPEDLLPWMLPEDVEFKPDGESPLAQSKEFVKRTEEIFGKGWRPEVDTLDTFMCSSWYFLRYPSANLEDKPFDSDLVNEMLPVDMYIGGPEHACMHLLYARFINMALHDMGFVGVKEPFKKLVHQGMVTKDGAKMSKSKGNVVSPDEFVDKYGSDVLRMYLMFMGPFTAGGEWNDNGINGVARFVEKFWNMVTAESAVKDRGLLEKNLHKLIKKVSDSIEKMHFNVIVAALMEFVNFVSKNGIDSDGKKVVVALLSPIAPHLAEECWEYLGEKDSVVKAKWPEYDEALVVDDVMKIGVQINGKVRGDIELSVEADEDVAMKLAKDNAAVAKYLDSGKILKVIYVKGRILNIIVG
jgi:leucyl-tRNA synthetase